MILYLAEGIFDERGGTPQEAVLEACLERFYSCDGGAQEGFIFYRRSKEQVRSCLAGMQMLKVRICNVPSSLCAASSPCVHTHAAQKRLHARQPAFLGCSAARAHPHTPSKHTSKR